jgi:hypothetical protein
MYEGDMMCYEYTIECHNTRFLSLGEVSQVRARTTSRIWSIILIIIRVIVAVIAIVLFIGWLGSACIIDGIISIRSAV